MTKIFFTSPVTSNSAIKKEEKDKIFKYVKKLEKQGYEIFWPIQDNPYQKTDLVGTTILRLNFEKMLEADEIHIWYVPDSKGINFDNGAAFMLIKILNMKKRVIFVNKNQFPKKIKGKNFIKVLRQLEKETAEY